MAGYHEHFVRSASDTQRRHLSDDALLVHIKAIHAETRGGYGWPRTWKELLARGIRVAFYYGLRLGELFRVEVVENLLVLADTKNGDPRVVPAHPRILVCLQHLPLTMNRRTLQADWQRARAKTVGNGIHFHDLRHSTASELVNAGVDLHTIGKVLGHRDQRSTDRYTRLLKSTLGTAINKIGRQKSPRTDSETDKKKTA